MTLIICFDVICEDMKIENWGDCVMIRLFRRKKEKMLSIEQHVPNYSNIRNNAYEVQLQSINNPNDKMIRLMELISCAIDTWAVEYHLENLPKKLFLSKHLMRCELLKLL